MNVAHALRGGWGLIRPGIPQLRRRSRPRCTRYEERVGIETRLPYRANTRRTGVAPTLGGEDWNITPPARSRTRAPAVPSPPGRWCRPPGNRG